MAQCDGYISWLAVCLSWLVGSQGESGQELSLTDKLFVERNQHCRKAPSDHC